MELHVLHVGIVLGTGGNRMLDVARAARCDCTYCTWGSQALHVRTPLVLFCARHVRGLAIATWCLWFAARAVACHT